MTFGEALLAYEESAIMGLRKHDGRILLNPPMDTPIEAGDKVIAISEDDDTVRVSDLKPEIDERAIHGAPVKESRPERTLLLGWNEQGTAIVHELDRYVTPGSELTVVADVPGIGGIAGIVERECRDLTRQKLTCREADTKDRRVLDALGVETFDQVILLCYSDQLDVQEADARTLITLLHLRDMAEKGGHDFRIVSEMLDVRNRELAEVTQADDFIVSNKLTSLMLSQISENKELNAVFTDVFDPDGSEIYLKPAGNYVDLGVQVSFYTVVEAARRRGEVAIGYRQMAFAKDAEKSYGVAVNPKKSERIAFSEADQVIVLAED